LKDIIFEIGPGLFLIFILEIVIFSFASEYFLSWNNFKNIIRASTIIGIMALGQTIVIISGGFDLSVGAVSAATGMTAAWLLQGGYSFIIAILGSIIIGGLIGILNGAITGYARINPLITTLGMMSIVRGLGFIISGGYDIAISNKTFLKMGSGQIFSIPYLAIVLISLFIFLGLAIPKFSFGRYMYAIGSNERACVLAGVRVNRWKLVFYGTCGALAGLAGSVTSARVGVGAPQINMGVELGVITAVILGGTALTGGKGRISGTFLGLFIVSTMSNGLVMLSVPTFYKYVATGTLLLSAVIYDEWRRSQYAKR
jgi:ribose/xylose/arabinose/galactoside ABC-type transport system permease subunit